MEKAISSDLIRGHIDTIILHTLLCGDKYAQQISDTVDKKSNGQYEINQATLYSSLKRLENLKYVTAYWNDAENGRRRYFRLTDLGRQTVENNLSNWSFSRAIIDKLIDFQSPAQEPIIVEKIVTVPIEVPTPITVQKSDSDALTQNTPQKTHTNTSEDNQQEINFRNILNGLIKTSVENDEVEETITPTVQYTEPIVEKVKFNQTILEDTQNHTYNNGKTDYGDLTQKAVKEGYKLRISNKNKKVQTGSLFINRINLCSALIVFLLVAVEYLVLTTSFKSVLNLSFTAVISSILILSIYPIVEIIICIKKPHKTSKSIKADSILTAAIVVFNLLLITFAGNLLFNVDFSDTFTVLLALIIPITLYLDIICFYTIRYILSKNNSFQAKK